MPAYYKRCEHTNTLRNNLTMFLEDKLCSQIRNVCKKIICFPYLLHIHFYLSCYIPFLAPLSFECKNGTKKQERGEREEPTLWKWFRRRVTEFFWEIKGEGKGEFKGKGQLTTPSAPSKKVLYLLLHSFHLREWTQLPRGSESARTPTCVTFIFKIF